MKNKNRKCFIDFDGTIVSNKKRLYRFFIDNIPAEYADVLSEDEFWQLKRMAVNEIEWLNKQFDMNFSVSDWAAIKQSLIETPKYLCHEELFDFSHEALRELSKKFFLVLVTRRENHAGVMEEITRFGLMEYFDDIIVLKHDRTSKSSAVISRYTVSANDIFVGDTEDDIRAGQELGCLTYLVLSGIRGSWIQYKFDAGVNIIKDIREICKGG